MVNKLTKQKKEVCKKVLKDIKICDGCDYEFNDALYWQKQGYHFASTNEEINFLENNKHFCEVLVDNKGNLFLW